jgi:hypothetical protein
MYVKLCALSVVSNTIALAQESTCEPSMLSISLVLSARYKGTIITTQYEPIQLPRRGISCDNGMIPTLDACLSSLDNTDLEM